jgi:uncharacterized protein with PIN domain
MKFIADVMLGRLAKWLRILGYDTIYDSNYTDDELFFKAHQEKRILLTRDSDLAKRMNPKYCFFINGQAVREQVKQVIAQYDLNTEQYLFTRCTLCNRPIQSIAKELVEGRVPQFVYNSVDEFYYCEHCDKIYWAGSHIKQVRDLLSKL